MTIISSNLSVVPGNSIDVWSRSWPAMSWVKMSLTCIGGVSGVMGRVATE